MMPQRKRKSRAKPPHLRQKPGPKPRTGPLVEGRDYFCGGCTGHKTVPCDNCVDGCHECKGVGRVACPVCNGGAVPTPPPEYL